MIKIGHRGAAGLEPENTMRSFKRAIDLDVDMIEFDVYSCKSGEVVVIHDDTVDRTTNGHGLVADMTLEELKKLDAGKGEKIPTLEEVLDKFYCYVNIEIKDRRACQGVVNLLRSAHWRRRSYLSADMVSSFDHYALKEVAMLNSKIRLGALLEGLPIGLAEFGSRVGAYSINVWKEWVTKELVQDAHNRGIEVYVYTVNDIATRDRLDAFGVDGIFTDYPDRV